MLDSFVQNDDLSWNCLLRDENNYVFYIPEDVLKEIDEVKDKVKDDLSLDLDSERVKLSCLYKFMDNIKKYNLDDGVGFAIISGIDVNRYSRKEIKNIFWLMSNMLGCPIAQSTHGNLIVDVSDKGNGTMADGERYHNTRDGGDLHTDSPQYENPPEILGLLCQHPAKEGGESVLISAYSIYNEMLKYSPDLLRELYFDFHFDKKGDVNERGEKTTKAPIFKWDKIKKQLSFRYLRNYLIKGHQSVGSQLTDNQIKALNKLDQILSDEALMFKRNLKAGEMIYISNNRVVHGRNAFVDYNDAQRKRLMNRVWLRS